MLKKIGFSSAALFAMLTCIQPAAVFAEGRDQARYNNAYTEQRNVRDQNGRNEYGLSTAITTTDTATTPSAAKPSRRGNGSCAGLRNHNAFRNAWKIMGETRGAK